MLKLNEFKNKKILILGFGQEGRDSFLFFRKLFPEKIIGIADQKESLPLFPIIKKDKNIRLHLGKNYLKAIGDYDLVIKSPGIPIHPPKSKEAKAWEFEEDKSSSSPFAKAREFEEDKSSSRPGAKAWEFEEDKSSSRPGAKAWEIEKAFKQKKITSSTEIFFNNCPGKIVGVTGTKGKGTTALMIYGILKESGIRAHLVGNIGRPALNYLFSADKEKVYIYELSSHQLYNLKKSPHIAVFLNIYLDHLDYFRDLKEYARAKANIAFHQKKGDFLVYNNGDKIVRQIAKKCRAKKIPIKGEYYDLNKNAARAVGKIFKIPKELVKKAIEKNRSLPHRLELVGTLKGITFYNDSAATMPEAAIAAIQVLGSKIETIILGGSEKNLEFKSLAEKILRSRIKNIILFPSTGKKIWQAIVRQNKENKKINHFFATNMQEAVNLVYQCTSKGKIALLSPASASFGIFENYKERGGLFKKYAKKLKSAKT